MKFLLFLNMCMVILVIVFCIEKPEDKSEEVLEDFNRKVANVYDFLNEDSPEAFPINYVSLSKQKPLIGNLLNMETYSYPYLPSSYPTKPKPRISDELINNQKLTNDFGLEDSFSYFHKPTLFPKNLETYSYPYLPSSLPTRKPKPLTNYDLSNNQILSNSLNKEDSFSYTYKQTFLSLIPNSDQFFSNNYDQHSSYLYSPSSFPTKPKPLTDQFFSYNYDNQGLSYLYTTTDSPKPKPSPLGNLNNNPSLLRSGFSISEKAATYEQNDDEEVDLFINYLKLLNPDDEEFTELKQEIFDEFHQQITHEENENEVNEVNENSEMKNKNKIVVNENEKVILERDFEDNENFFTIGSEQSREDTDKNDDTSLYEYLIERLFQIFRFH